VATFLFKFFFSSQSTIYLLYNNCEFFSSTIRSNLWGKFHVWYNLLYTRTTIILFTFSPVFYNTATKIPSACIILWHCVYRIFRKRQKINDNFIFLILLLWDLLYTTNVCNSQKSNHFYHRYNPLELDYLVTISCFLHFIFPISE